MWNVDGIRGRAEELRALIDHHRPDIAPVLEVKAYIGKDLKEALSGGNKK